MRRLVGLGLMLGLVLCASACKAPAYPKDNPRLPKDMQNTAEGAAGTEAGSSTTPADGAAPADGTAPADGGATPPADGTTGNG
ncbi:MAG: hypothetical protein ABI743_00345 [bacterium]